MRDRFHAYLHLVGRVNLWIGTEALPFAMKSLPEPLQISTKYFLLTVWPDGPH